MQTVLWEMLPNQMNATIPERKPAAVEISGVIERVTIHNEDSALRPPGKTKGHREKRRSIGSLPPVSAGNGRCRGTGKLE